MAQVCFCSAWAINMFNLFDHEVLVLFFNEDTLAVPTTGLINKFWNLFKRSLKKKRKIKRVI